MLSSFPSAVAERRKGNETQASRLPFPKKLLFRGKSVERSVEPPWIAAFHFPAFHYYVGNSVERAPKRRAGQRIAPDSIPKPIAEGWKREAQLPSW